jgi:aerobic-type carbon monoxide dehydrogenase small subunit (CoxS/CutS family)
MHLEEALEEFKKARDALAKEWNVQPELVHLLFLRHSLSHEQPHEGCDPASCYTETAAVNKYLACVDYVIDLLEDVRLP